VIFLGMILYLDLIKLLIDSKYHEGIKVVPLILLGDLFFGIFFSASIWFKLKDKTWYGAIIAVSGAFITIMLNIILIQRLGYMGSAVSIVICFFFMMIINYFWGKKYYPIQYDFKRIAIYFISGIFIFFVAQFTVHLDPALKYTLNTTLFALFLIFVLFIERKELKLILGIRKG
jgi:O-antigen/teichoic acid export membrane protein